MRSSAAASTSGSTIRRSRRKSPSSKSACPTRRSGSPRRSRRSCSSCGSAKALQGARRVGNHRLGGGAGRARSRRARRRGRAGNDRRAAQGEGRHRRDSRRRAAGADRAHVRGAGCGQLRLHAANPSSLDRDTSDRLHAARTVLHHAHPRWTIDLGSSDDRAAAAPCS